MGRFLDLGLNGNYQMGEQMPPTAPPMAPMSGMEMPPTAPPVAPQINSGNVLQNLAMMQMFGGGATQAPAPESLMGQALASIAPAKPTAYQRGSQIGGQLFDSIVIPMMGTQSDAMALGVNKYLSEKREDKQKEADRAQNTQKMKTDSLVHLSQLMETAKGNDLKRLAEAYSMDKDRVANEQWLADQELKRQQLVAQTRQNELVRQANEQRWEADRALKEYIARETTRTKEAQMQQNQPKVDAQVAESKAKTEQVIPAQAGYLNAQTGNIGTDNAHQAGVLQETTRHNKATEGIASGKETGAQLAKVLASLDAEIKTMMANGAPKEQIDILVKKAQAIQKQMQGRGGAVAAPNLEPILKRFGGDIAKMRAYRDKLKAGSQ